MIILHALKGAQLKYLIAALLVTSFIAINDFANRVWLVNDPVDGRNGATFDDSASLWPAYSEEQKSELTQLYKKYDYAARVAAEKAAKNVDDKDQAQVKVIIPNIDKQQGKLLDLYTESSKLSLKAVINEKQKFALVQQHSHENEHLAWLKLVLGQTFEGFTVVKLNHTSIVLVRGEQTIELLMYKINS